jgi:Cu/Ag efflux pump CusA
MKDWQRHGVAMVYRRFRLVMAALAIATLAAVIALPFLPSSFMPDFRENHFVVQVDASIPGASLAEMRTLGTRISADIMALPHVSTVSQQIGRAELGEDTNGPHQSEFQIELKPGTDMDQSAAEDAIRKILANYPGVSTQVTTFLGDRIDESLSGDSADISVKVFGDDLNTPTLAIQLDPQKLAASGLKSGDVLDALESDFAGTEIGQTYAGIRAVDVTMILPAEERDRPELLSKLMIGGPLGPIPLSEVAHVVPTDTRYMIAHDGGQRFDAVTFNVRGRGLQNTVNDAKAKVSALHLPEGVIVEFTGAAAAEQAAQLQMLLYTGFALILIGLLLFISFRWRRHTWLVLVNVPFSLIGSVLAIVLLGSGLSLGAMVGLVTVFGISARNAILLLAHYEHLVESEGEPWNVETVLRGAQERLIPILMTAAVTALGLLPLAIGMNQPGQEIEGPMAVTVLGGLMTSTLLNLMVLPALAERFGGPRRKAAA